MSQEVGAKATTTVLLIGNNISIKKNIISFLDDVCTGKPPDRFLDSTGVTVVLPQTQPIHIIRRADETELRIINYPELFSTGSGRGTQDVLPWLQQWTTIIDAFIVVVDSSKSSVDVGTTSTLEALASIFPRGIHQNVFFLCVASDPSGRAASIDIDIEAISGLPSWLPPERIVLFDDVVARRNYVQAHLQTGQAAPPELRQRFARKFSAAKEDLEKMLESFNRLVVQTWDMSHLYMRATIIESELYAYLSQDTTSPIGSETLRKIDRLVGEYSSLALSPDFTTHVEIVHMLLRSSAERGIAGIDGSIRKLNEVRNAIRVLEGGSEKYPKGFVVC